MITLTAKINLLSGDNNALSLGSDNLSGNNISRDLSKVVGVKKNGSNPFIIGASKLGDGSTFSDGVDYFIGDQLSDENGNFANPYEIQIKGNIEGNLTISFDKINNRHPNKIKIKQRKVETVRLFYRSVDENNSYYISEQINKIENSNSIEIDLIKDDEGKQLTKEEIDKYLKFEYFVETENEAYLHLTVSRNFNYSDFYDITIKYNIIEKEYIDDDSIFTMSNLSKNEDITIKIDDWNSPKYPIVITGIYALVDIVIDRRNLISLESSIFDRSDLKLPSFGIISNTGNIEFNDLDGEIKDYAEQLLLQSGLSCEIRLNNTLVDGASELVAKMETDQWDYDNDNRVVSVSIKDDLEEWQDINVAEIPYDPRKIESKPFSWLYEEHLWAITNPNYPMQKLSDLDEQTYKVLTTTYIQYPLLESGSLWQQWTKLCQACQLHIYKNSDGVVVCRYNGGN